MIPEEGRKIYWLRHSEYNNEDEDNSSNILSDKKFKREKYIDLTNSYLGYETHLEA